MSIHRSMDNKGIIVSNSDTAKQLPKGLIFLTPVWGKPYVDFFLDFVIRNLADDNAILKLAEKFDCKYIIYTNQYLMGAFKNNIYIQKLSSKIEFIMKDVEDFTSDNKYKCLSACYNDAIKYSFQNEYANIFLNSDMIYSKETFSNILKTILDGYRCIEIDGFRIIKEKFVPEINNRCTSEFALPARELVGLSIDNMHFISKCHFWDNGKGVPFMPFHTYWRVGDEGLIGRISHIYPIYFWPVNQDNASNVSIDWDLVDNSGIDKKDIFVVQSSDYIYSVEISSESYHIEPLYPEADIHYMAMFVLNYCKELHLWRLKKSIEFLRTEKKNIGIWREKHSHSQEWVNSIFLYLDPIIAIKNLFNQKNRYYASNILMWKFRHIINRYFVSRIKLAIHLILNGEISLLIKKIKGLA
jgi:hypothetical protein